MHASELTKKPTPKRKRILRRIAVNQDLDGSNLVQGDFQKIYKDADPDARWAMTWKYQESNGTNLSTNWSVVGRGPVETSPPEGTVAKKWME